MDSKIRIISRLEEGVWEKLTGWREHVFPEEGIGKAWTDSQKHVIASVDREVVAHLGFGIYPIQLDEQLCRCIGVGGVVVLPQFQGQHIPQRLFDALRLWRERHQPDLALTLFCPHRLAVYYQRHGFTEIALPLYLEKAGQLLRSSLTFMSDREMGALRRVRFPTNPW